MNKAYLLIGGNLGDRISNLESAFSMIDQKVGRIVKHSFRYETPPWGPVPQPYYLNQCLAVETLLPPLALLKLLLEIEQQLGRVRTVKLGPRLIDIDILLFNDLVYRSTALSIPHPELANRRFALVPLNEIAPDLIHPVRKKTISRLLKECKDRTSVQLRF